MTAPDQPFLPLLYKVNHRAFNSTLINDLGNEVEGWDPAEEWDVYGWGPPEFRGVTKEVADSSGNRYTVAVEVMVPPGVYAKDNDRIQLDDGTWYRVVGPTEDYSHNPFEWNPGNVINLVTTEGAEEL